jgi:hypothetical protein
MGFLDNSGDIILDAVLTDTGRMRLSRGDGSFRITKFALGDDEINYGNYDINNLSGSAYYDLNILKTPIFEAFTNNTSNMNSKLLSYMQTDLLYLPVIKLSTEQAQTQTYSDANVSDLFLVTVDDDTTTKAQTFASTVGIIYGTPGGTQRIRLDQGLDNSGQGPSPAEPLAADLTETQYIVEMDNRFGFLYSGDGNSRAEANFVDDDNIASYFVTSTSTNFVFTLSPAGTSGQDNDDTSLAGPRGTSLRVQVKSSINLSSATNLFTTLGSEMIIGSDTYYTIDTTIRVTGATTGYRVDVPIRYIKLKS